MLLCRRFSQQQRRVASRMLSSSAHSGENYETLVSSTSKSKLLVTCEHAGSDLPSGVDWGPNDILRELPHLHWAYDPGAKEFAVELGESLDAPVVMSKFSRLFCDVNRPVASRTLARPLCDNLPVELNETLTVEKRWERISKYYLPYHNEIERVASEFQSKTAISVHTYTDNYEGSPRDFEIGVLFSTNNEKLVANMTKALVDAGLSARINEPWSGKDGFMYSADCFSYNSSTPGQRDAVMLEFRNDVCVDPAWRAKVISILTPIFKKHVADS